MGFRRVELGQEEIFNIVIQDPSGIKVGEWKVMKRDMPSVIKIINDKYGLGLSILNRKNKEKEDLDWALK